MAAPAAMEGAVVVVEPERPAVLSKPGTAAPAARVAMAVPAELVAVERVGRRMVWLSRANHLR